MQILKVLDLHEERLPTAVTPFPSSAVVRSFQESQMGLNVGVQSIKPERVGQGYPANLGVLCFPKFWYKCQSSRLGIGQMIQETTIRADTEHDSRAF